MQATQMLLVDDISPALPTLMEWEIRKTELHKIKNSLQSHESCLKQLLFRYLSISLSTFFIIEDFPTFVNLQLRS